MGSWFPESQHKGGRMGDLPMKGKILHKPYPHMWFKIPESDKEEEYKYTCELNKEWTPFNSNLHMQGIKVVVNNPVPESHQNPDSFENTMMLLEMMKEKKLRENKEQKDEMIRLMALEKKKKLEESRQAKVFIKTS